MITNLRMDLRFKLYTRHTAQGAVSHRAVLQAEVSYSDVGGGCVPAPPGIADVNGGGGFGGGAGGGGGAQAGYGGPLRK